MYNICFFWHLYYFENLCLCPSSDFCLTYVVNLLQSGQTGNKPHLVTCAYTASDTVFPSSSSSCNAVSMSTEVSDYVDCDWSEHICPDGHLYYYNCVTCESRVRIYYASFSIQ